MCFIITSLQCGDINKEQNTVRIQMEINRHNDWQFGNCPLSVSHTAIIYVCIVLPSVLDDDDVEILDLIARTGGDLGKPRPLTGSSSNEPGMEDYSLAGRHLAFIEISNKVLKMRHFCAIKFLCKCYFLYSLRFHFVCSVFNEVIIDLKYRYTIYPCF